MQIKVKYQLMFYCLVDILYRIIDLFLLFYNTFNKKKEQRNQFIEFL